MILIVAKDGKTYYIKEMTGAGIFVEKNEENRFLICVDNRIEPIAIYKDWENANIAMGEIMKGFENNTFAVIKPND